MTDLQCQRFLSKVEQRADGCWEWVGTRVKGGYGRFTVEQRPTRAKLAHRLAYEHFVGPIPEGRELDHLCRNRACVNPTHVEPVTHLENCHRGDVRLNAYHAQNVLRQRTHCRKGHSYADAYSQKGARRCKTCQRAAMARWRDKSNSIRKAA